MINMDGRWVCWDWALIEKSENVRLSMHKPVRKNIVMTCDEPWEGEHCGYMGIMKAGDTYRLYYRGAGKNPDGVTDHSLFCMAESKNGKTFTKPELCEFEFLGSRKNNIFYNEDRVLDNFAVVYDTNPDCPADAKFKAMSQHFDPVKQIAKLGYYKSADGIHFEFVGFVPVPGAFDSYNVVMWNPDTKQYHLYLRNFHLPDGTDWDWNKPGFEQAVRDIRLSVSQDFVHWSEPKQIQYQEGAREYQLYTNQVSKYPRADIFIGMPVRYCDRKAESWNYKHLPQWDGTMLNNRLTYLETGDRTGTALTECILMTSRDGVHFNRTDEAFLEPGVQNGSNWVYGEGYVSHGLVETTADWPGEPNELSFYAMVGYRTRPTDVVRYAVRLDGFFSWRADFAGGKILTKPLAFTGSNLSINFATSAMGALRIRFCDLEGNDLEGYDSGTMFGNSVDRPVEFEKPLADLSGKAVRMKLNLWDCDLYSFCFEEVAK